LIVISQLSCAPKATPYANGPVMSQKNIRKTFQPILQFMDVKPGIVFADIGASSGAFSVMMATLMDNSKIYIQDIDTTVLRSDNLDKIISYYSKQNRKDLMAKNSFYTIIGSALHSNLPNSSCDIIWSNGTVHNFTSIDSMMTDLGKKLKPGGLLFLRDSFKNDHREGSYCSDVKCAKPLLTIDEFLNTMDRNGFKLVKRTPDMTGYPVFGFTH
jgi:SAM-dependent methyltransferase